MGQFFRQLQAALRLNKVASEMSSEEDRDPKKLSEHLQISWQEVIGEPADVHSPECAWRISTQCFQLSRNCCYIFLSVILAPIYALCLGCTFACLAFKHVWCITPCLRIWKITCHATRACMLGCSHAILVPISDALGHFWANIRVRTKSELTAEDLERRDVLIV